MADVDRVGAELIAMRERAEQITTEHDEGDCDLNGGPCTGHDAIRLINAVEAVRERHRMHGGSRECPTLADIERELTGGSDE